MIVPDLSYIYPGHTMNVIRSDERGWSIDVYDVVTQRLTSNHYWIGDDGRVTVFHGPGRYIWPAEMDLMAQLAGMELENRWAGWKKEPFTERSASHVSVYKKP
jgi:hypothetical protein